MVSAAIAKAIERVDQGIAQQKADSAGTAQREKLARELQVPSHERSAEPNCQSPLQHINFIGSLNFLMRTVMDTMATTLDAALGSGFRTRAGRHLCGWALSSTAPCSFQHLASPSIEGNDQPISRSDVGQ
jgi:hypothetical protein